MLFSWVREERSMTPRFRTLQLSQENFVLYEWRSYIRLTLSEEFFFFILFHPTVQTNRLFQLVWHLLRINTDVEIHFIGTHPVETSWMCSPIIRCHHPAINTTCIFLRERKRSKLFHLNHSKKSNLIRKTISFVGFFFFRISSF